MWHFEMEDDADGVTPWYCVSEPTPKYVPTDEELELFVNRVIEAQVVRFYGVEGLLKLVPEIKLPEKHEIDLNAFMKRAKETGKVGVYESYFRYETNAQYCWRIGITAEEYLGIFNGPIEPADIISVYGNENTVAARVVLSNDSGMNNELLEVRLVDEGNNLKTIYRYLNIRRIHEWDLYVYELERLEEGPSHMQYWWYPVQDTIDNLAKEEWLTDKSHTPREPRVYAAKEIPDADTLAANTVKYEADMYAKIENAIMQDNVAYIDYADKKSWFWYENIGYKDINKHGYHVFKVNWDKIAITKSNDPFELAAIHGYDISKCSLQKPEKGIEKSIVINREGITVTICENIDLKKEHFQYGAFKEVDPIYFRKERKYVASKDAIMTRFKELNIDKYEVNKLTQVWHYVNFANAIKEVLNMGYEYGSDLKYTELRFLINVPILDAKWIKRRWRDARKSSKLTPSEWIEYMTAIKTVAEKLGFAGRDPEVTYNAIEDYAEKQHKRYLDSLGR